jgi:hypothetical protein
MMADLRERLIAAGWRQGVILEPSSLQQAGVSGMDDAVGFLVLTQTCDCINPDFRKEPHLELLPMVLRKTKKGKPDPAYEAGKNPREIHFWILLDSKPMCAVAHIKEIQLVDRKCIEDFRFSDHVTVSPEIIDDMIEWRAARYFRTAFPEAFETAFRTITTAFGEIITMHESDIDSLLIRISPFEEIEEGECYEIQLYLMVTPFVMGQPETIQALEKSAKEIEDLFATCAAFGSMECSVTNLDEVSLWKGRRLLDFSRYDYLSFGKEEDSPED